MTTAHRLFRGGLQRIPPRQPAARRARDLIWQLHAVYWRNKRLGHPKAVGLLIQYARAWAARNPAKPP